MSILFWSLFIIFTTTKRCNSQASGRINDNYYMCVPQTLCNDRDVPGSDIGIDPRIVSPGQSDNDCSLGQIACFTQGEESSCGYRYFRQTRTSDGYAENGVYPWQVLLRNSTDYAGSGVLLDNYHILTAAHKVFDNRNRPESITAFAGAFDPNNLYSSPVQNRRVSRIEIHEQFNKDTLFNDIAILRVTIPFSLSSDYVNTACLPVRGDDFTRNEGCVVSGWGQTSFARNDAPTRTMKQVFVKITDYNTCRRSFVNLTPLKNNIDRFLDPAGEICAGGEALRDACTQDGGSPLVCPDVNGRYYVAGLVIWGKNCGQPGVYGVYVSVPYYRNWIDGVLSRLNRNAPNSG